VSCAGSVWDWGMGVCERERERVVARLCHPHIASRSVCVYVGNGRQVG
jgi:hypothetical protein